MPSSLQREIKQTKPFRSLQEEAMLSVALTARRAEDAFDALMKAHGISMPQYNTLRILRGAGPDGLGRNDIRDRLVTRMPDVTRLLDRLEAMGLVRRARETDDRRVVTTTLTEKGAELLASLDEPTAALNSHLFRHLDNHQLRTLIDLLALARTGDGHAAADHPSL